MCVLPSALHTVPCERVEIFSRLKVKRLTSQTNESGESKSWYSSVDYAYPEKTAKTGRQGLCHRPFMPAADTRYIQSSLGVSLGVYTASRVFTLGHAESTLIDCPWSRLDDHVSDRTMTLSQQQC